MFNYLLEADSDIRNSSSSVAISPNAPLNAKVGDLWYVDSEQKELRIFYSDSDLNGVWLAAQPTVLNDLFDVTITSAKSNDLLTWDSDNNVWVNAQINTDYGTF